MNLEELGKEISEREELLRKLDPRHPLYPIMERELLGYKERFELVKMSEERENRGYREK